MHQVIRTRKYSSIKLDRLNKMCVQEKRERENTQNSSGQCIKQMGNVYTMKQQIILRVTNTFYELGELGFHKSF